ncbi:hypothetical protein [Pseudolactococcus reticulitermitis]|uniref:WxL domain-containing protein n=1 Tax=Pseudolactococcus reticulitermitis TaxID=2025039 RepID=A0A224X9D1_9LACT|nr:hypothetical protein [Lactococcus reticulitermitis]GAX47880.1 hypothetical protein RsY01_1484 [Lactococcus reticulitermitis]
MLKQKKRQAQFFSCIMLMGLTLVYSVVSMAATQDSQTFSAPLAVTVPSTYTVTIPQKLSLEHLETGKQYLAITVDAMLQEDEQIQLLAVNAPPDGLVGLTNGKETLNIEHRRAEDDSKITRDNAIIGMFKTGKSTHVSVVQSSDWDSITTGGTFRGNFSYSVKVVKGGG